MGMIQDGGCEGSGCLLQKLLVVPEIPVLRRMAAMTEEAFRVPVAYLALLDNASRVAARVGSGSEHWPKLRTYPVAACLERPAVVHDASWGLPMGTDFGEIRFAAAAPLRPGEGAVLGLLVIADFLPKINFSDRDLERLEDLAADMAQKMELRLIARRAVESERALRQRAQRSGPLANSEPLVLTLRPPEGPAVVTPEELIPVGAGGCVSGCR